VFIKNNRYIKNDFKRELFKTGGGGADLVLSAEQEIFLASIRDHVQPLENEFDCAADYFSNFTGLNKYVSILIFIFVYEYTR
jgi:hypothetical protein